MTTMTRERKADREAREALKATDIDTLLTKAFALTHRIHALDKIKKGYDKDSPQRLQVEDDERTERRKRDMIVAEIKRRCAPQ